MRYQQAVQSHPYEPQFRRFDGETTAFDAVVDAVPDLDHIPTAMEFRSWDSSMDDDLTGGQHSRYTINTTSFDKYSDDHRMSIGSDDSGVGPFLSVDDDDCDWVADSFDHYDIQQAEACQTQSTNRQRKPSSLFDNDPITASRKKKRPQKQEDIIVKPPSYRRINRYSAERGEARDPSPTYVWTTVEAPVSTYDPASTSLHPTTRIMFPPAQSARSRSRSPTPRDLPPTPPPPPPMSEPLSIDRKTETRSPSSSDRRPLSPESISRLSHFSDTAQATTASQCTDARHKTSKRRKSVKKFLMLPFRSRSGRKSQPIENQDHSAISRDPTRRTRADAATNTLATSPSSPSNVRVRSSSPTKSILRKSSYTSGISKEDDENEQKESIKWAPSVTESFTQTDDNHEDESMSVDSKEADSEGGGKLLKPIDDKETKLNSNSKAAVAEQDDDLTSEGNETKSQSKNEHTSETQSAEQKRPKHYTSQGINMLQSYFNKFVEGEETRSRKGEGESETETASTSKTASETIERNGETSIRKVDDKGGGEHLKPMDEKEAKLNSNSKTAIAEQDNDLTSEGNETKSQSENEHTSEARSAGQKRPKKHYTSQAMKMLQSYFNKFVEGEETQSRKGEGESETEMASTSKTASETIERNGETSVRKVDDKEKSDSSRNSKVGKDSHPAKAKQAGDTETDQKREESLMIETVKSTSSTQSNEVKHAHHMKATNIDEKKGTQNSASDKQKADDNKADDNKADDNKADESNSSCHSNEVKHVHHAKDDQVENKKTSQANGQKSLMSNRSKNSNNDIEMLKSSSDSNEVKYALHTKEAEGETVKQKKRMKSDKEKTRSDDPTKVEKQKNAHVRESVELAPRKEEKESNARANKGSSRNILEVFGRRKRGKNKKNATMEANPVEPITVPTDSSDFFDGKQTEVSCVMKKVAPTSADDDEPFFGNETSEQIVGAFLRDHYCSPVADGLGFFPAKDKVPEDDTPPVKEVNPGESLRVPKDAAGSHEQADSTEKEIANDIPDSGMKTMELKSADNAEEPCSEIVDAFLRDHYCSSIADCLVFLQCIERNDQDETPDSTESEEGKQKRTKRDTPDNATESNHSCPTATADNERPFQGEQYCCSIVGCFGNMQCVDEKDSFGNTTKAVAKFRKLKLDNGDIDIDQAIAAIRRSKRMASLPIKTIHVPHDYIFPSTSSITDSQEAYKERKARRAKKLARDDDEVNTRRVKKFLLNTMGRRPSSKRDFKTL